MQPDYDNEKFENFITSVEKDVFGYTIRDKPQNLSVNIPLTSMLGRSAKNFTELSKYVIGKSDLSDSSISVKILAEYKYDGERTQIHFDGQKVNLFSRNFELQNLKYFELHKQLENYFLKVNKKIESCILDGEILYHNNDGSLLSFQEIEKKTTNRTDVYDKYPAVYLFDIMYFNGKTLIDQDIETRKGYLDYYFKVGKKSH